jgi:integral membrane protein
MSGSSEPRLSQVLRLAAIMEGTTLLLLVLVGVPLKHGLGIGEVTRWLGPIHGFAFLFYVWAVINELAKTDLPRGWIWRALGVSFLPGGTFWFYRHSLAVRG